MSSVSVRRHSPSRLYVNARGRSPPLQSLPPQFPASLLTLLTLLTLLLRLEHLAATVRAYQLLVGQSYDSRSTYYEITADRLRRLILERARSLAEQRFLNSMEGVD
ncbi:MAG: hypothetical protein LBE61_19095 [Burkholderiaceae bacterium]|jgi:hypothetical protein|nr:hypothetical protein [Burkholderiaceae bacterium]